MIEDGTPPREAGAQEDGLSPEVLRRLPLLASLADGALAGLARQMRLRRFARQDTVVHKGSAGGELMFLLAGQLQVVDCTEDGREIGLNIFTPGAFFGELALIDGHPRSASVVAMSNAVVAYLPRTVALRTVYGNPAVAEHMLKHFAASIRNLSSFRALLAIPNAYQRVCALLCQVKRGGAGRREVIENLPTHQQMAIMINTSRETVTRTLADLVRKGILHKAGRSYGVADPVRLERLANGEAESG
jgi:CRP-like cAMP-binding protein